MGNNYKTVRQVAEELGVKVRTIREWIVSGKMTAIKDGKCWLIHPSEVERMSELIYQDFSVKVNVDGRPTAHVKSNTPIDIAICTKDGLKMRDAMRVKCVQTGSGPAVVVFDRYGVAVCKLK